MYENLTDPAEIAEAHAAWKFVLELRDQDLLDPNMDQEALADVRVVIERARADAVREHDNALRAKGA